MQLQSVNLSCIREVLYKNKTVKTGIFKQPTDSAIQIEQFNMQGDEQADLIRHGGEDKAIYGFASEHYQYWQQTLQRSEIPYGKFGENLTISGLDESKICIGDHIQVGSDVILQATQPREPCFKLAMTFGIEKLPKLFIQYAHPGIYFRVIQTGQVKTGDKVSIIHQCADTVSIQAIFRACTDKAMSYDEKHIILEKAAALTALSEEWKIKVAKKLTQLS